MPLGMAVCGRPRGCRTAALGHHIARAGLPLLARSARVALGGCRTSGLSVDAPRDRSRPALTDDVGKNSRVATSVPPRSSPPCSVGSSRRAWQTTCSCNCSLLRCSRHGTPSPLLIICGCLHVIPPRHHRSCTMLVRAHILPGTALQFAAVLVLRTVVARDAQFVHAVLIGLSAFGPSSVPMPPV